MTLENLLGRRIRLPPSFPSLPFKGGREGKPLTSAPMPINIELTTSLHQDKVGAKASGSNHYDATQWPTWEPWYKHLFPPTKWEGIWQAIMADYRVTNPPPFGSVDYVVRDDGPMIYNISNGYIWPRTGSTAHRVAAVYSSFVSVRPNGSPRVSLSKSAALLDHHVFYNRLTDGSKVTEKASVSLEVKQGVSSEWSKERTIGGSVSVGVKVGVEGAGDVETSATFSWESKVGESHSQSKELGAGDTSELEVELEPGDYALGMFGAYLGDIVASLPITATLQGGVVFTMPGNWYINFSHDDVSDPDTKAVHRMWISWDELNRILTNAYTTYPTATATLDVNIGWYADTRLGVVPLKDGSEQSIDQAVRDALNDKRIDRVGNQRGL